MEESIQLKKIGLEKEGRQMNRLTANGWKELISVSGDFLEKEVKNEGPAIIRGYIELIEEVIRMFDISPDKLRGGSRNLRVVFLFSEPKAFKKGREIECKGKSFSQIKEELEEEISPRKSPFWEFGYHFFISPPEFIAFEVESSSERGRQTPEADFEYQEQIADPIKFYQEMWDLYPITGVFPGWDWKEKALGILKDRADLKAGAIKQIEIDTGLSGEKRNPWASMNSNKFTELVRKWRGRRIIDVDWTLSLFYKEKEVIEVV